MPILTLLATIVLSQNAIEFKNNIVTMRDIKYVDATYEPMIQNSLYMDVSFPTTEEELLPAISFIHGGGWSSGNRQDGIKSIETLAIGGYFAATIDYRVTDEKGFPAAIHDCKAAIRFLRMNANDLSINPDRIGVIGYSSGGYLAAMTGLSQDEGNLDGELNGRSEDVTVACIATINGALLPHSSSGKNRFFEWIREKGNAPFESTLPTSYFSSGDPPIYVLSGDKDNVCPLKDSLKFAQEAKSKQIDCEIEIAMDQGHKITNPKAYIGLFGFLDKHLGGEAQSTLLEILNASSSR